MPRAIRRIDKSRLKSFYSNPVDRPGLRLRSVQKAPRIATLKFQRSALGRDDGVDRKATRAWHSKPNQVHRAPFGGRRRDPPGERSCHVAMSLRATMHLL